MLVLLGVIATLHLTGDVPPDGGDYLEVPFTVPAGTVELQVAHDDGSADQILDWGVWSPERVSTGGFRGWGGGLTDPAVIGVAESSRGYLPGAITPGTWTVVIGKAKLDGLTGHYTIDVELRDAATLTPGPSAVWQPVTLATERRWYAGDFHVHSVDSGDATATLDEIVGLARLRGLDFVELSDHNTSAQVARLAARQAGLTDLLLLRGAEITTYQGHGNGVGIGTYVDHRVGLGGVGAPTIVAAVRAQGGVFVVNHPALDLNTVCIGCAWKHADTPWDQVAGMEIQTGNADLTAALFTPRAIAMWDAELDLGYHLAAIGGSDDHRAGMETSSLPARIGSPTTMVLADNLSEAAIVAAIAAGRTVVKIRGPADPMVDFRAVDHLSRTIGEVGDTVEDVGQAELQATIAGGDGMTAELWRDGVRVDTRKVAHGQVSFYRKVTGDVERYRLELTQDGQRVTVTSHIWIHGNPANAPDCLSCAGDGRGGLVVPGLTALALAIVLRRRRPRRAPR